MGNYFTLLVCASLTMLIFISSLLLTFAASDARYLSFRQDGNGTDICPTNPDGYLHPQPCPWDCTKYYICEEGNIAIEMDCAPPLVFDPDLEICNWPFMVNCEATTTEAPETTSAEPVTETSEAPTDSPTDSPTNVTTDAPTNAPTNAPTDVSTDAPTNAPTNAPTDAPTD